MQGVQHSILDGPPPTLPKISKKTYRTKIMKQPPPPPPPTDATTTATTTTITAVPPPGKVLTPAGLKDTAPVAPRPVGTRRADTSSQPLSGTVPPTQLFGRSSSAGSQGLGATQRSTFSSVEDLERFAQVRAAVRAAACAHCTDHWAMVVRVEPRQLCLALLHELCRPACTMCVPASMIARSALCARSWWRATSVCWRPGAHAARDMLRARSAWA